MSSQKGDTAPSKEVNESSLKSFLAKLRKRHIIETLAAFIGGGWLVIEVVERLLVSHYHFPEETIDLTVVSIISALFCTLIWRWFSGTEKRPGNVKVEVLLVPLVVLATLAIDLTILLEIAGITDQTLLITIVAICFGIAWIVFKSLRWATQAPGMRENEFSLSKQVETSPEKSIAVLPFKNMSLDEGQEYFCDGMTVEVISDLSNVRSLRVISRSSAMTFKGTSKTIPEIARELSVQYVLEGSVRKAGNDLKIAAQLIDALRDTHIWTEKYSGTIEDVFEIQDKVSQSIVGALKLNLTPAESQMIAARPIRDPQAYDRWLRTRQESYCGVEEKPGVAPFEERKIIGPKEELPSGTLMAGKYRLIKVVGRGGMGIVYGAEDMKLKRLVALKFLPREWTQDKEARERFLQEARSAAALSHPNICTIYEVDDSGDQPFIAMEFVEGETLSEKTRRGPLPMEEALSMAAQAAEGLEAAHRKGIIHRDIKCANIMVTDKGQAKIMDFGLAKLRGGSSLTKEGATIGTVAYMSPEQARGEKVDHRTDIWSLGVVLYEMLTGELPFRGERDVSLLYSIVHEKPKSVKDKKPPVPPELQRIIERALEKNPDSRYQTAAEIAKDIGRYQDALRAATSGVFNFRSFLKRLRRPIVAIPCAVGIIALSALAIWIFQRQAKIRWAKNKAVPEIKQLWDEAGLEYDWKKNIDAYDLAEKAEKVIPQDPGLKELWPKISNIFTIETVPAGAKVYMKRYSDFASDWKFLGITPLEKIRVPVNFFLWKIEKEGYEPAIDVSATWDGKITRTLDKKGALPQGMVTVTGRDVEGIGKTTHFFIDKYEVTNRQYKEFIDNGGYRKKELWKNNFIKDGKELTWEEAMPEFVDSTGRAGPAIWEAGAYPAGQEDYPVSGISWFEAAAYAEFVGKSLPTIYHWQQAAGLDVDSTNYYFPALLDPLSNWGGSGPAPVGSHQGITMFGAYDMAGNVREWCWNETPKGRLITGGAWNDATYLFGSWSQASPFDRSQKNGFRCAVYLDFDKIAKPIFQPAKVTEVKDWRKEKPVSDSVFQVYKEQFTYDKIDLNARVEWRNDTSKDWIQERITFNAAYDKDRMIAYLFLPKNSSPPYQTVIYFPGSGSVETRSSKDLAKYGEFEYFLSFIVKNGRAVLYPVYWSTFERGNEDLTKLHVSYGNNRQFSEYRIKVVKDFKRCIDYLETRQDIDNKRLAYLGFSWGGMLGAIIPAVEERLKASILANGGMWCLGRPEIQEINYVTRVKIPTLMLNGRFDMILVYETDVKPMFDLLGTSKEHKTLKIYDTDHSLPGKELIKETLSWLDKYLGPVK